MAYFLTNFPDVCACYKKPLNHVHFEFVFVLTSSLLANRSLRFSAINGDALPFIDGLPENYNGLVIKGAFASYTRGSFGYLVLQEFTSRHLSINHVTIIWENPERLICHYQFSPVLFARLMLKNNTYEVIKGAGDIYMEEEQFNLLTGRDWNSILITENPGVYQFINLAWSADILDGAWGDFSSIFNNALQHFYRGFPQRVTGCVADAGYQMKRTVSDLMATDYTSSFGKYSFNDLMLKCIKFILDVGRNPKSIREEIGEADWHLINKAKQLIFENLVNGLSTPQISSQIMMNENKLKKYFLKATGFSIDEYRRHHLMVREARNLIKFPDRPLKSVSSDAGYPNVTNFIRAFKKSLYCTPNELRLGTWDLSKLNNYILPESDTDETE